MPLIEVEDKLPGETVAIRLRPEVARELRAYGEFAQGSSASHVIAAALIRLFRADKEFADFLKEHPDAGALTVTKPKKTVAVMKGGAQVHG
jgi:hypothetical protein